MQQGKTSFNLMASLAPPRAEVEVAKADQKFARGENIHEQELPALISGLCLQVPPQY
jgi:hypothetical protein